MVRAFAGDSTITSGLGLGTCEILVVLGTKGPTGGSRPHRGATNGVPVSNIPYGIPCGVHPASCSRWVLSIVSTHALGGTEPEPQGYPGLVRPMGDGRALPHHLCRDRVADRVLPSRRFVALHRRHPGVARKP